MLTLPDLGRSCSTAVERTSQEQKLMGSVVAVVVAVIVVVVIVIVVVVVVVIVIVVVAFVVYWVWIPSGALYFSCASLIRFLKEVQHPWFYSQKNWLFAAQLVTKQA